MRNHLIGKFPTSKEKLPSVSGEGYCHTQWEFNTGGVLCLEALGKERQNAASTAHSERENPEALRLSSVALCSLLPVFPTLSSSYFSFIGVSVLSVQAEGASHKRYRRQHRQDLLGAWRPWEHKLKKLQWFTLPLVGFLS